MKKLLCTTVIASTLFMSGCLYHPPVFQGNILKPEKLAKVHNGMTEADVIALLGTPVLKNIYAENDVMYVYTSQKSGGKMSLQKVEIDFHQGRVSNVVKTP